MKRIVGLATGVWPYIAVGVVLRVAQTVTFLVQGLLLAAVLTNLLDGDGVAEQRGPLIGIAAMVLVRAALIWASRVVGQRTAAETKRRLRARAFDALAALGPGYTTGERTGEAKAGLVEGIESLESYYADFVPSLVAVAATPVLVVAVLAMWDGWLALLVAGFVVAAVVCPMLWQRMLKRRSGELMKSYLGMGAYVLDTLQGLVTLKIFGATGRRRHELAVRADRLIRGWNRVMAVALVHHIIYSVAITGGVAAAVAVAAVRTASGGLAVGALFVTLVLAAEALRAVAVLASSFHASYNAASAADVLYALFDEKPAVSSAPDAVWLENPSASVRFERVGFGYDEADVLTDLDLVLEPGETVAVVGPSGAGKTTIVSLLLRFFDPRHGRVLLGGHDIRDMPLEQLRSLIAVVSQDTYLFGGSVRENLLMARADATDAQLVTAARAAGAHDFITALPGGYDCEIGERGLRLSGGQRQRLAIARAVLADAPILVLDEATASVDAATEASIHAALDRLTRDRTTLVIAHRLSTVRSADRIVVLDGGRVTESGDHDELLSRAGGYARLVSAQEVH